MCIASAKITELGRENLNVSSVSLYEFDITFVMLFVMLPQLPYHHGLVDRVTGLNCRDSSLIPDSAENL